MSNSHKEETFMPIVELAVLLGHKNCGMTFHTISHALRYDNTGEKTLLFGKECQKFYNDLTDTTKTDHRPRAIVLYEGFNEEEKMTRANIVREGLRRA